MVLKVTCCPGWPGYGSSGLYFFPGLFFTSFFIFSHLWWFGVLGFGSWIGFLGLGFSVDGVLGLWCEAIRGFWGWGSLYKQLRITLGKNFANRKSFPKCWHDRWPNCRCCQADYRLLQKSTESLTHWGYYWTASYTEHWCIIPIQNIHY